MAVKRKLGTLQVHLAREPRAPASGLRHRRPAASLAAAIPEDTVGAFHPGAQPSPPGPSSPAPCRYSGCRSCGCHGCFRLTFASGAEPSTHVCAAAEGRARRQPHDAAAWRAGRAARRPDLRRQGPLRH
jgi:hypothetical protein